MPRRRRGKLRGWLLGEPFPIPFGALVAITYVAVFRILSLFWMTSVYMHEVDDFWLTPAFAGLSHGSLMGLINILFLIYLALQLGEYTAGHDRKNRARWVLQAMSILLVLLVQVFLFRMGRFASTWEEVHGTEYYAHQHKYEAQHLLRIVHFRCNEPEATWREDCEKAVEGYTKFLAVFPDDREAYEDRGLAHLLLGRCKPAVEDLTRAIELPPRDDFISSIYEGGLMYPAVLHDWRGRAHYGSGDYDAAIRDFGTVIAEHPSCASAYHLRACAHGQKGDYARALQDHNKAVALQPSEAEFYCDRATTLRLMGDLDRAIMDGTAAIELAPDDAAGYVCRGLAYVDVQGYDQAIADFSRAIELDPGKDDAYFGRGTACVGQGRHEAAIADFTEAIKADPLNGSARYKRGVALLMLERPAQAVEDFARVLELSPDDPSVLSAHASALGGVGRHDEAISGYSRAIELEPQELHHYLNRGTSYEESGQQGLAALDYRKALELDPMNSDALKQLEAMRESEANPDVERPSDD
jgi:tetratricopeptide (TPR) repeat protein